MLYWWIWFGPGAIEVGWPLESRTGRLSGVGYPHAGKRVLLTSIPGVCSGLLCAGRAEVFVRESPLGAGTEAEWMDEYVYALSGEQGMQFTTSSSPGITKKAAPGEVHS
jgi:hypothetical protein